VIVALALLGLGAYGLTVALQQRPYLGQAATTLLQVPLRVLAEPNLPAIALFLLTAASAVAGAAWFILRLLHQIFFRPVRSSRVWREALMTAVYVVSLAWLQLNQAFSLVLAVVIAAALILLEIFPNIRVRDE
jgi:hypothetical protein